MAINRNLDRYQVSFTIVSGNEKTGPIPVSVTSANSCPKSCPFYDKGCYSLYGNAAIHWNKVSNGERGSDWLAFIKQVKSLPKSTLWRHNVAGDLIPNGNGVTVNKSALEQLVSANKGKSGFTYSHHKLTKANVSLFQFANNNGFTVNVSTEDPEIADKVITKYGIPAVAVIPSQWADSKVTKSHFKTKSGRLVVVCPASRNDGMNCAKCKLCAMPDRTFIIGFPAHGSAAKTVNGIVSHD